MKTAPTTSPVARDPHDLSGLVHAAADGDQAAWNELVHRYGGLIRSVTRRFRLSDDDAADVAQTTWLRLAMHIDTIYAPQTLPRWLVTTARHECLRTVGNRREQATAVEDLDRASEEPGPAERIMNLELTRLVRSAVSRLPEREARLLGLLMQSARPGYAHIAETLEMPIGSIGPVRSRALDRVRAELAALDVTAACG